MGDLCGSVGVGACGDDLPAQLTVALQSTDARVGLAHSFGQCGSVDLDALIHTDQTPQDLFKDIPVFFIRISLVFLRAVAHHIVQMAVDIEVAESLQILRDGCKVFQICLILTASFVESRIVRILPVADVGGGDDEIILMGYHKSRILPCKMGLHPQFYAEAERDLACVSFL